MEIQRLVGRSIRAVIDLDALGERTVYLDCDVLEADGGTRCAAITGAYVALKLALDKMVERGALRRVPLRSSVAAVSSGIVAGEPVNLIETLADRLTTACLSDDRVLAATVTVHKPQAPIAHEFADVAVTLRRTRTRTRTRTRARTGSRSGRGS